MSQFFDVIQQKLEEMSEYENVANIQWALASNLNMKKKNIFLEPDIWTTHNEYRIFVFVYACSCQHNSCMKKKKLSRRRRLEHHGHTAIENAREVYSEWLSVPPRLSFLLLFINRCVCVYVCVLTDRPPSRFKKMKINIKRLFMVNSSSRLLLLHWLPRCACNIHLVERCATGIFFAQFLLLGIY